MRRVSWEGVLEDGLRKIGKSIVKFAVEVSKREWFFHRWWEWWLCVCVRVLCVCVRVLYVSVRVLCVYMGSQDR